MRNFTKNSLIGDKADCPACSGEVVASVRVQDRFIGGLCSVCDGLIGHGHTYYDTLAFVGGNMLPANYPRIKPRYFDLTYDGDGGARRHGFYDPTTRLITQIG